MTLLPVRMRSWEILKLGEARLGAPTGRVAVTFPRDGRLVLRVTCADKARCHSLWLWEESGP